MFERVRSLWTKNADDNLTMPSPAPDTRRNRQKNLKASSACLGAFTHIAEVSGMSEAALFEDMVAQRLEELKRSGKL
jgi:hypothetical protein